MTRSGEYKPSIQQVVQMLRTELTWYPGRTGQVARMVFACTSVMVLAEVFRIPGAVLGASFPILVSRDSPEAARKSAFQIALACSIGTVAILIGGVFTAGSSFLHVLWVLATLIAAFYAMSSLNFASPALTASALIAIGIQEWDYPVSAELRVEHTLYTLLSIVIGCLIAASIETFFAKKDSPNAIFEEISSRLGLVEALMIGAHSAGFPPSALAVRLSRSASKGVDGLFKTLARSCHEPRVRDLLATLIPLTQQLLELGSILTEPSETLTTGDREHCLVIAGDLSWIRARLASMDIAVPIDLPFAGEIANPILSEIKLTVDILALSFGENQAPSHLIPSETLPGLSSRAFPFSPFNSEHFKFAVRGTLPTFLCYLFHLSIGWPGLAASILTCALTARRVTGASRQRQVLRFTGFLVGAGVIGWSTEVLILPQLDSLAEYAILFASVVWLGSWVASSGPRIAFSGFQIVIAYSLVSLNRFTINTSLVPSRDAVLSIMLGVLAMWLVFDHLWPESAATSARILLATTLKDLASFATVTVEGLQQENQRLITTNATIRRNLDILRDLNDMHAFEHFPGERGGSLFSLGIRELRSPLRAFLFAKSGLLQHRILTTAQPDVLIQEAGEYASNVLTRLARAIEDESVEPLSSWDIRADSLRARVVMEQERSAAANERQKYIEMRLCVSMLDLIEHIGQRSQWSFGVQAEERRSP